MSIKEEFSIENKSYTGTYDSENVSHQEGETMLDENAIAAYRQGLIRLKKDLQDALDRGYSEKANEIKQNISIIEKKISNATGPGGRRRRFTDNNERARKAVSESIRRALKDIQIENNALWLHLKNSLKLGLYCSYCPDEKKSWIV
jgi:hypothetical protein